MTSTDVHSSPHDLFPRGLLKAWFTAASLTLVLFCSAPILAQDKPAQKDSEATAEEGTEQGIDMPKTGAVYIPFKPPFVVNYGGPGRLRFMKADISVRLNDTKAANSVLHHMPYIRNNLVMLFSAQTDESISSQDGKEALRQEALKEVQAVLMQEDRQDGVIDLYFNTILVQQ